MIIIIDYHYHIIECPAEGIWEETEANTWASVGCGNGFQRRFCGPDGQWTTQYDLSACYCAPQSGWALTLSGETASRSCPAGSMTRACNADGSWAEIDYSDCKCKGVDGFEDTPVNTPATIPCRNADGEDDEQYSQTRYCGADGEWSDVDQSQCPVKWCPTVQSWYSVPVGLQPTTVTIGCMSGYRTRVCNINGAWGPVNTDHCQCTYNNEDGDLTLLNPSESYSLRCDQGERSFTCNAESGYFDPVNLDNCACASNENFPTTGAGRMASFLCGLGVATRKCGVNGFWETANLGNCFCDLDGVWPQSHPGDHVSVLCDSGFRRRTCGVNGQWEEANDSSCKCSADGLEANYDETISVACSVGATLYHCGADGHFETPDDRNCFCPQVEEYGRVWAATPAGGVTPTITCMNGQTIMRTCSAITGVWESLDTEACRCLAEDVWEEKGVGEIASAPCANSAGTRYRQCFGNQWGPVDDSECLEPCVYYFDEEDREDAIVPVGESITVPCYVNLEGSRTYTCKRDTAIGKSVLELTETNCTRLACMSESPASPADPFVYVGESETVSCAAGQTGMRTHTCLPGGVWGPYEEKDCVSLFCEPITLDGKEFAFTIANNYAHASCPAFYAGNYTLFCNEQGEWASTYEDHCQLLRCQAEGDLPEANAGVQVTVSCPADYTGAAVRTCQADGIWSEVDVSSCVPVMPTVHTIPFQGMTHVSRTPSAVLLSSLALKAPFDRCTIAVQGVANAEEQFYLRVNTTKSEHVGRHRNGGIFADFVVPEDAQPGDATYLGYGEYKMTFPNCWTALNGAVVPENPLEVTFHTAPVPPSAPANARIEPSENSFTVHFDAATSVDAAYPVIAYYLAFQPPVLPEVRVDASARSFGPFAYIPGELTLLLRAESALGLSSPDVEVLYSFSDVVFNPDTHVAVEMPKPVLSLHSEVAVTMAMEITIAVAVPDSARAFADSLDVTCNGESVAPATSLQPALYTTVGAPSSTLTITCFFTLGTTAGQAETIVISVKPAPGQSEGVTALPYGPVQITAEETHAQELTLRWTAAPRYVATPIDGYYVQCRRHGESAFPVDLFVTALEVTFDASELGLGPVDCRVAATSLALGEHLYNWSSINVDTLHKVTADGLTVSAQAGAVTVQVSVTAIACVPTEAIVRYQGEEVVAAVLACGPSGETGMMTATLAGLTPATEYEVEVIVPSLGVSRVMTVTTAAATAETLAVEMVEVSSTSATLKVTASSPDAFYCVASTTPVPAEQLYTQVQNGLHVDEFFPAVPAKEAMVDLLDLHPATAYAVTCIARRALTSVMVPTLFTTAASAETLSVLHVEELTPGSHLPSFLLTFNGHIQLGENASMWVHCGGLSQEVTLVAPVAVIEGVYSNQLRVNFAQSDIAILPTGATCSMGFTSLSAVQRLHADSLDDMLGDANYAYTFTVTSDAMRPVMTVLTTIPPATEEVSLVTISEPVVARKDFAYTVVCKKDGEITIDRAFSTEDYPIHVVTNGPSMELAFHVGLLPYLHECELRMPADMLMDEMMNPAILQGAPSSENEDEFVIPFIAPISTAERMLSDDD